jgi:RNA polymerase sigma-70 factor (ECF subfamily)
MAAVEASMLAGLRTRDRAALAEIVKTHHGFLISMVTPLVSREFAEDVVQEAWIKIFAAADRFEGRSALRTWLAQIALNTARSWRRSRRREAILEWGTDTGSPLTERFDAQGRWSRPPEAWHHNTPDALLTAGELRACLEMHLERLPPDQQTVLRLRDIECMELADITAITELSEGNVRVLLHRARQRLHVMLEHFEKVGTC